MLFGMADILRGKVVDYKSYILSLLFSSNGNRFSLYWPLGSKSAVFEVPAGAKLRVLIGAVLNNPGETCDLSFQLVPPGAK